MTPLEQQIRSMLSLMTLTFDEGMALRKITGWGARVDATGTPIPHIGNGREPIQVVVVQDRDTPLDDQDVECIPWFRVVQLTIHPALP